VKVLVTGATGFLGRSVVKALAERGHDVVAVARPAAALPSENSERITYIRGDLRQRGDWVDRINGVEAVVHAAAAVGGSFPEQFAGTVVATENLLDNIDWNTLRRFVLISSFSVYDYARGPSRMDERHPLEADPSRRDAYTWTKMLQEDLVERTCKQHEIPFVSIRPGAIYGPGKDWDAGSALSAGKFDLLFSPLGRMRLTHVDNCADAIAAAVEAEGATGAFNIVDDEQPTHARYHSLCRRAGAPIGRAIYIPWWLAATAGLGVKLINTAFFKKGARLPEILDYPRQRARWKGYSYSNARAKQELGWTPRVRLADAVPRMFGANS
jgi:nucleoside-diphosphate-sugar epimerase